MKLKKKIVISLFIIVLSCIIAIIYCYCKNDKMVAVLGYHDVVLDSKRTNESDLVVNTSKFENQLKLLKKMNYKTITLDEFYCWKQKKCKKHHNSVLITFDDGYVNNYKYAFDLLKKYNMNAVVFYWGINYKDENKNFMDVEIIKKSQKEYPNIEFASHSYNMHNHNNKSYEIVNNDIKKMKSVINSKYYAYPFGDYNDDYIKALKDNGYKLSFGFGPEHRKSKINDNNYVIPRLNISNGMPDWKFILRLILPM